MTLPEQCGPEHRHWISWRMMRIAVLITIAGAITVVVGAILAPFLWPPRHDQQARDKLEIFMLAQATTAFEAEYWHRPPSASMRSVRMHALTENRHFNFGKTDLTPLMKLDDAERLVFWLGGPGPETNFGLRRRIFFDFLDSRIIDRDADGFPECASRSGRVFEYDPTTTRISCDFSKDELTYTIDSQRPDW